MSLKKNSPRQDDPGQPAKAADHDLELLISEALRAPDPQFALSHDFAKAIATKAMPAVSSPPTPIESKGFMIALVAMASTAFFVACWALGITESLANQLMPYKYLLGMAILLVLAIQLIDNILVKQRQSII